MLCAHLKQKCTTMEEDLGDKRKRTKEHNEGQGARG
jgi:hypothetical protein